LSDASHRHTGEAAAVEIGGTGKWPKEAIISLAAFVVLWHFASMVLPPFVAPSWARIGKSLLEIAGQPEFIAITIARVAVALVISFFIGLGLAMLMYWSNAVERYSMPMVKLLMAVPVLCWILFAVLWFKMREVRIAFILIVVCAPIFVIDILDGMQGVRRDLRDMVRALRPSPGQYFAKLILPATIPSILTSWKVNLSLAIRVVTMAELVGATSGIGYALMQANETFSIADVFAWTVVLVVILMLAQMAISLLERRLLVWRD
jgi:NitT/TauT family transport system permease protein